TAEVTYKDWLCDHPFRLDCYESDWPLVAHQRVLIDVPIELVHAPLMIEPLIHGARLHGEVLVGQGELCHLARLDREHGALCIDPRRELRPHLLEHDTEARRMNDPLPFAHQLGAP